MKPAPFRYIAASSVEHALSLKAEHGEDARFLAGGQSLIPAMNFRLARPAVLIDINGLAEIAGVTRPPGSEIRIGAVTRYRALERDGDFIKACPLFADALPHIAHPAIRNRGTIGGNLSHADPASELPAVALAMQARMRVRSVRGERELSASEFFVGLLTTAVQTDEMLTEIIFPPPPPGSGSCFMEIARRRGDFALAGVAAVIALDAERRCATVRLALCGVGDTPVDAGAAAACLLGQPCNDKTIAEVAAAVRETVTPSGSVHASAAYQRHVAGVLVGRALKAAHERIGHAA
ncbi:FAD binding domain-containing protein [Bradyrhizobium sp.]|uniref:FAD binding domain-containing protein n=1 Tax=Bradyrhizobium sp. TaxID=376 RepID=UPI0025BD0565|nr:xanthine dehydrogenase family protein subunit M [Bradyrhizobium sp.]MBV8923282.1 xanthine dehydrogenase family protein subunit M [Bradyrhizobium sp.]